MFHKTTKVLLTIVAVLFCADAAAQFPADTLTARYARQLALRSPEKVYLHVDRAYYAIGETIHFSGYVSNAAPFARIPESNFIYVELLNGSGVSINRVKVKRDSLGAFPGSMYVNDNIPSGTYTLRAYTLWQMNDRTEYMFHEKIRILGASTFSKEENNISKKKEASENGTRKKSGNSEADVTFYPEGGRYFAGSRACIGFKVMNPAGDNLEVSGAIVDSKGVTAAEASTLHDGMGRILFTPQKGEKYTFRIDGVGSFELPAPAEEGATIGVSFIPGHLIVNIAMAGSGKYHLYIQDNKTLRHISQIDSGSKIISLGMDAVEPGISRLILADRNGNVVAQRPVYTLAGEEEVPQTEFIQTNRPKYNKYDKRALITSEFRIPGGETVNGRLSVSVVRGSFRNYQQNEDIVSYLRLSSELAGSITNPSYYFCDTIPQHIRQSKLDLLMMIQGWKYYDVSRILSGKTGMKKLNYGKEFHQFITGKVRSSVGKTKNTPVKYNFTIIAPKMNAMMVQKVESGASFIVDSLDFKENTGFIIQLDRQTFGWEYEPVWDGEKFAPKYNYKAPGGYVAKTSAGGENIPLIIDGLVDTLEAAVVTARNSDPFADRMTNSERFDGDMDRYSSHSLIEYLNVKAPSFYYDGEEMWNNSFSVIRNAGIEDDSQAKPHQVALIVDDTQQEWWLFESLKMEDIAKLEISQSPSTLYNSIGGHVAIKLKSGVTFSKEADRKPSVIYFLPLGYQVPDKFYSPRYDKGDKDSGFDHRNTVYWNPCVEVAGGRARIEFCNTDQMDFPYIVRIEGITDSGKPFSWHGTIREK